jgi:hypothetical protein
LPFFVFFLSSLLKQFFSHFFFSFSPFSEYKKAYEELRVPIPEKALHLSEAEGRYRPLCFTNFEPHFNPKHLLDTLVLGGSRWEVRMVDHDYTHELFTYGYQDTRPSYHGVGGDREIHLRIDSLRSGEIRVCGYLVKNALSRVEFYFDENYPFPISSSSNNNNINNNLGKKENELFFF